jgi:hypothetical protein
VNFTVGWSEFILSMNVKNFVSVPVHNKKMSSINLLKKQINESLAVRTKLSIFDRKMFAKVGAALVPMAVPLN